MAIIAGYTAFLFASQELPEKAGDDLPAARVGWDGILYRGGRQPFFVRLNPEYCPHGSSQPKFWRNI